MNLRILTLLAGALALPGLCHAQTAAPVRPPTRQSAPVTPGKATPVAAAPALIDINSADEKTLDTLPGVGAARVKAIIANRPYTEKPQLVDRKVLPANTFATIQDKIALVNVNVTTAADMAKVLPNVGAVRAQQIVDKRPYAAPQDLVTKGALTQGVFDGLKGLITTGP